MNTNFNNFTENGLIEFNTESTGAEWTLSAVGDTAPFHEVSGKTPQESYEHLKSIVKTDLSIVNLETASTKKILILVPESCMVECDFTVL